MVPAGLWLKTQKVAVIGTVYAIITILITWQSFWLTLHGGPGITPVATRYNNYVIFKQSFFHLIEEKPLYVEYPQEHWDLYKYTPTFSLFFGLLAGMPDWLGLALWNLINALVFVLAINLIPGITEKQKWLILLLSLPDAVVSLQNSQSNLLIAGMLIMGYAFMERGRFSLAILLVVATFFIKIYGIVLLVLLLLYPHKVKNFVITGGLFCLLFLVPVVVTGFDGLINIYGQYAGMIRADQSVSLGFSFMGWLHAWFGVETPKTFTSLVPLLMILLLVGVSTGVQTPKAAAVNLSTLLLMWMVVFNHKAESPTFIIATAAIYIWYIHHPGSRVALFLTVLVFIFTSLSSTDLFPVKIRKEIFVPLQVKVVPCILVWFWVYTDIMIEIFRKLRNIKKVI